MTDDLVTAIAELKESDALKIAEDRLNGGDDPMTILADARRAMQVVGKRFETG